MEPWLTWNSLRTACFSLLSFQELRPWLPEYIYTRIYNCIYLFPCTHTQHMSFSPQACKAHKDQKRVRIPWNWSYNRLWAVVSARNQTGVLQKSSRALDHRTISTASVWNIKKKKKKKIKLKSFSLQWDTSYSPSQDTPESFCFHKFVCTDWHFCFFSCQEGNYFANFIFQLLLTGV